LELVTQVYNPLQKSRKGLRVSGNAGSSVDWGSSSLH